MYQPPSIDQTKAQLLVVVVGGGGVIHFLSVFLYGRIVLFGVSAARFLSIAPAFQGACRLCSDPRRQCHGPSVERRWRIPIRGTWFDVIRGRRISGLIETLFYTRKYRIIVQEISNPGPGKTRVPGECRAALNDTRALY